MRIDRTDQLWLVVANLCLIFTKKVKELQPDIPILLQSTQQKFASVADELEIAFLNKYSPLLLTELKKFLVDNFGFGDFIFRMPDGKIVGRASNLKSLEEALITAKHFCTVASKPSGTRSTPIPLLDTSFTTTRKPELPSDNSDVRSSVRILFSFLFSSVMT